MLGLPVQVHRHIDYIYVASNQCVCPCVGWTMNLERAFVVTPCIRALIDKLIKSNEEQTIYV